MQGLLFSDRDLGKGGRDGYLNHRQQWCVEFIKERIHITSELLGSPGSETDPPRRTVTVESCDGSCRTETHIPDNIWEKARPQLEKFAST